MGVLLVLFDRPIEATRGLELPYVCSDGLENTSGLTGCGVEVEVLTDGWFRGVLQL